MKEKAETVETEFRESMSIAWTGAISLPGAGGPPVFLENDPGGRAHAAHDLHDRTRPETPRHDSEGEVQPDRKELKFLPEQLRDPDQGPDEMEEGRIPRCSPLCVEDQSEPSCGGSKGV